MERECREGKNEERERVRECVREREWSALPDSIPLRT